MKKNPKEYESLVGSLIVSYVDINETETTLGAYYVIISPKQPGLPPRLMYFIENDGHSTLNRSFNKQSFGTLQVSFGWFDSMLAGQLACRLVVPGIGDRRE